MNSATQWPTYEDWIDKLQVDSPTLRVGQSGFRDFYTMPDGTKFMVDTLWPRHFSIKGLTQWITLDIALKISENVKLDGVSFWQTPYGEKGWCHPQFSENDFKDIYKAAFEWCRDRKEEFIKRYDTHDTERA